MSGLLMNDSGVDARIVKPIESADHSPTPSSGAGDVYCQSTVGRMNAETAMKITNSAIARIG